MNPDVESLFSIDLTVQRERFLSTLSRITQSLDTASGPAELLARIGRENRKFGVTDRYYAAFAMALKQTVRHFSAASWSGRVAAAWQRALGYVAATIPAAAAATRLSRPPGG